MAWDAIGGRCGDPPIEGSATGEQKDRSGQPAGAGEEDDDPHVTGDDLVEEKADEGAGRHEGESDPGVPALPAAVVNVISILHLLILTVELPTIDYKCGLCLYRGGCAFAADKRVCSPGQVGIAGEGGVGYDGGLDMKMMSRLCSLLSVGLYSISGLYAQREGFPIIADDLEVALFARDPLVRNPCAMAFDAQGRLCVGMGPQYRKPKPETPGDSVWILLDEDRDGQADGRKQFATGFNSIQGLAWKGGDLWIANAPDLTVVRDLDGDDVADEYVRVYTDLGNLEHALHGLNFGPDGKLYMSKGNSKGLTLPPGRVAPAAFRELWGVEVPAGTPDIPPAVTSSAGAYQKNFHDPADDWGMTGGVLRCEDDGSGLEIISRGFRNPWDICFDDGFDWLGTDNDQTMGDKIFAPFYGAHFGWGHAWSYDWKGDQHLPTAPSSGPLFDGSGTGIIFCGLEHYPDKYRGVYLINDWLRREVYLYRPTWQGALRVPESGAERFELLAHAGGGRSMPQSHGRAFDPVDIEIGPDGAIWVASWGREYGAEYRDGEVANEGRIYRIWPKSAPPVAWGDERDPRADLASHLPVWRTNAQEVLLQRGETDWLREQLGREGIPKSLETWAVWTLGRIDPGGAWFTGSLNQRIQSLRLQAFHGELRDEVRVSLSDPEPRIRFEAVLAIRQAEQTEWIEDLLTLAEREDDRLVNYALWGALMDLEPVDQLRSRLTSPSPAIRLAALLALLEQDALDDEAIRGLVGDGDPRIAALAQRRLGGKATTELRGRPLRAGAARAVAGEKPASDPPVGVNPFGEIRASSGREYKVAILEPGVRLYTDRPYRITGVPPELLGEAFLQTANHDADDQTGVEVEIGLKFDSTLYLADDARGEVPPAWMREGWELTKLTIAAEDPRSMRVYRREFDAGSVVKLGANRDGVTARKGNYIIVVRPKLLGPDGGKASLASVLAAMPGADTGRGRDLFLSRHGANCAACHQLENIGQQHAPDLSEIGSRADAEFLIQSILNPSASITEGFAALLVKMDDGNSYMGNLLQETNRSVTLAMAGGATVELERKAIASSEGLEVSAMPAGFGSLLSSQQVADIVAYLLEKKGGAATGVQARDAGLSFERDGDSRLLLKSDGTRIATYVIGDPVLSRRALVNLVTESGIPVTRRFPAPQGSDHTHMHPGIWLGFGWISGNDYWRLQSEVVFERFLAEPAADGGTASFTTRNRYLNQHGDETICVEDCAYRFTKRDNGMLIEIDATYFNDERDFEFGDQEESGLALRVAEPLSVEFGNGEIINDRGERDGAETWGKEFRWIDYSGVVDGKQVGILLVPHPGNSRTSWAHSRDYGVLVANPFPKQPRERREPYVKTLVKKGERFRLRYTVLIHESPPGEFDPAGVAGGIIEE